jgi:intracellular multiplication protein IcmE
MSGTARFGGMKFALPKLGGPALFSGAGRAGPRRLVVICFGIVAVTSLVIVVTSMGHRTPPFSHDARMASVDALPGGLHSTPEQDALARQADTTHAQSAMALGSSYTPPLGASVPVVAQPPRPERAAPQAEPPPPPHFVGRPTPAAAPATLVFPPPVEKVAGPIPMPQARPIQVAEAVDPQAQQAFNKQIGDLFSQWGGRAPQTDVILPPKAATESDPATGSNTPPSSNGASTGARAPVTTPTAASLHVPAQVLIPAGRGVYAHPILALSSDQTSPVVMQADSGPIAGDRLIGGFARQDERLVIHISQIIHNGQSLGCDGVVIAPDTMEASVATDVDQHYLTRFILPAAAAFVQGLGQALATTSNTTAVLSPFGGATTSTNLNFHQQLGVAAGVAAGQIGTVLNQAAPKGPTVSLDANVSVGVMFLSDVKLESGG